MPAIEPHRFLEPVTFLLGRWTGEGRGLWTDDFTFSDDLAFEHDGRPVIWFHQRTVTPDGRPSHAECGYLRPRPGGFFDLMVAEPSGITEVLTGQVDSGVLALESVAIGLAPSSDHVTRVARRLRRDGEELVVELDIAVNGEPLAPHTRSVLHRVGGSD